jgi:phage FluMu protein Com
MPKNLEERIYDLEEEVDALREKVSDLSGRLLWLERKLVSEEYGAKTGYTTIRCRTCGKIITKYKGHIGLEERMHRILHHYKTFHPKKFREIIKRSVATRMKRRKKK